MYFCVQRYIWHRKCLFLDVVKKGSGLNEYQILEPHFAFIGPLKQCSAAPGFKLTVKLYLNLEICSFYATCISLELLKLFKMTHK